MTTLLRTIQTLLHSGTPDAQIPLLKAVDCHLHVQSTVQADQLLQAMDRVQIHSAILMGSSKFTITLRPLDGFTAYHENNMELLRAKKAHPDRFVVWPTVDPLAPNNRERLRDYVGEGASGLKLYVGHGFSFGSPPKYLFHTTPINSQPLMELYQFCDENSLPICLHINTTNKVPEFRAEFEQVLTAFPTLRILAPHWMLASRRPKYLRSLFERFPNLRTDTSFGQDTILEEGLRNISQHAPSIRDIILDFPDRVLFGSDLVCTDASFKTVDWMMARMLAYKYLLASKHFTCPITHEKRTGLNLPHPVLTRVLKENALRLMNRRSN